MSEPGYFLDVNVPMYAAGKAHSYKEPCATVLTAVAQGQLSVGIDTEIIQEILYRYGALREIDLAVEIADSLLDLIPTVYSVTATDMRDAIQLFNEYSPHGVKARDVVHVAVMRNNGLAQIISTDKHFDQFSGITRHDPRDLALTLS